MAVVLTGRYTGDLGTTVRHELSGRELTTAAPLDNKGDGSSFSPTDLLAASLASCVVTVMAIAARGHGFELTDARFRIEKHMAPDPRRVARLPLVVTLPASLRPEQRDVVERAGRNCPIHHSIHPDLETDLVFEYESHDP